MIQLSAIIPVSNLHDFQIHHNCKDPKPITPKSNQIKFEPQIILQESFSVAD